MFDHVTIAVSDLKRSGRFCAAALAPLGYAIQTEITDEQTGNLAAIGLGTPASTAFWLVHGRPGAPMHLAFAASNHAAVNGFYRAASAVSRGLLRGLCDRSRWIQRRSGLPYV